MSNFTVYNGPKIFLKCANLRFAYEAIQFEDDKTIHINCNINSLMDGMTDNTAEQIAWALMRRFGTTKIENWCYEFDMEQDNEN